MMAEHPKHDSTQPIPSPRADGTPCILLMTPERKLFVLACVQIFLRTSLLYVTHYLLSSSMGEMVSCQFRRFLLPVSRLLGSDHPRAIYCNTA